MVAVTTPSRRMHAPSSRAAAVGLLLLGALALCACGAGGYTEGGWVHEEPGPPVGTGGVYVDNLAPEYVETFFLAPAATGAWSGELLGWPLAPGESAYVAEVVEDLYDAEADLEFGDLVQWFDVWVPAYDATWFEVW